MERQGNARSRKFVMAMVSAGSQDRYRRTGLALWLVAWVVVLAAAWYPIQFQSLRLVQVLGSGALWVGALALRWRRRWVRVVCGLPAGLVVLLFVSPRGHVSATDLRAAYVESLTSYLGTVYLWGGECHCGIDCSGLVRRGLMDAELRQGVHTLNPGLVRTAADLWWHDCSAKALRDGYRGQTRLLFTARSLNGLDYNRLLPGDIAVTSSGVHTLAYIGDHTWIEADPGAWKVVEVRVPTRNAWFNSPVHLMRWTVFDAD